MDTNKQLLVINGQDKSDSVTSYCFENGKCHIVYRSSPKVYDYSSAHVQVLNLQNTINPRDVIITANGTRITGASLLLDFGEFYRIVRHGEKDLSCRKRDVLLERNCLADEDKRRLFDYFKETAGALSLVTEDGMNILSRQYDRITDVSADTVLASYMDQTLPPQRRNAPSVLIYPFGLNQSQKKAVENAFSSQISIIQGPPGTGKTQTILNIIANAVRNGKTVAVVSNNNAATLNVAEKLEKKGLSFISAFLGSHANKTRFLESQSGLYQNMDTWALARDEEERLNEDVKNRCIELNDMLNAQNRIAGIEREILELKPEQYYFGEYYSTYRGAANNRSNLDNLSSQKILALWLEYEQTMETGDKIGLLKKIAIFFRFNISALQLFRRTPELVIPYLQKQFYTARSRELSSEKAALEKKLENYAFDAKMSELEQKSLELFRAELARRYPWRAERRKFESRDFRFASGEFNSEYPVILSTTYSIKSTLDSGHSYDYLIVDEASQVDIATGVLAFSCARNIVIVGDRQQLPNVLADRDVQIADDIWKRYAFDKKYRFSAHSLLSSANAVWTNVPSVLLREHYRCHPKIAGFFNQKFYNSRLIVMTHDRGEPDVLTMYRTAEGNHARGHLNQRQIDVIKAEVIPHLERRGQSRIGIIAPYREQVDAIRSQLGDRYETATVHKFQGREKDAIILSSVDNVITDFVDDPHMLNVAVSRAVKSLSVIVSQDSRNDSTNFGDLVKYIEYNNGEVINSAVFSVFDLLYKGYALQRQQFLQNHKRVSEYDSENLMYSVIQSVLKKSEFSKVGCAWHVSLATLIRDFGLLNAAESKYARNPLTHTDFILFNKMDKAPVMAIEVDGTSYHAKGSKQADRDTMKNEILMKCRIPLLRLRTDESNETKRIEEKLKACIGLDA